MSIDMIAPAIPVAQADPVGGAMPGWHIYADLTPPELITLRRVRSVRVWVFIAVLLVTGLVAAGTLFARMQAADAAEAVAAEEAHTAKLRAQQNSFASVTALQAELASAQQQLGTLLASDVDVDQLIHQIWSAQPPGMAITQLSVDLPPQIAGKTSNPTGVAALDTSSATHIGTVTLIGTGESLDSLPMFIDRLQVVPGIYSPFPTSNAASADGGTTFSLQFTLTDAQYSGLYVTEGEG